MISIENDTYVVRRPEYGIEQNIDPVTGAAFVSEEAALAWEQKTVAAIEAQQHEEQAARLAQLAAKMRIELTADKTRAMVGELVTVEAVILNALDEVVSLDDEFAVPVTDDEGRVALIKLAKFENGRATVAFRPGRSGYFCITENGINRRLGNGLRFDLPAPLDVVVFE